MATFVTFPGTAGNYVSTDDVNVLDCDSSWFAQGTGGLWTVGAPSTEQAKGDSPRSLKVIGGVSTAITPATDAADFSLYVYSAAGDDFDINGGTPVTVTGGVWTKIANAGNAGTYTVNAAGAGDYYLAEVMLGAVSFVPSLRIVGDTAEIKAKAAVNVGTRSNLYHHTSEAATTNELTLDVLADGKLQASWRDSAGAGRFGASTVAPTWANAPTVSAQIDTANNEVKYYEDDVQLGTTVSVAGADGFLSGGPTAQVGNNGDTFYGDGAIYWAEVRDGISGPAVARFDADDVPIPAQLPSP